MTLLSYFTEANNCFIDTEIALKLTEISKIDNVCISRNEF